MFKFLGSLLDSNEREVKKLDPIVEAVNGFEGKIQKLSDINLKEKTQEFRKRLEKGGSLDEILPEAFAAVREAAKRTIGQRHYDVQITGGAVLHQGKIAEMKTGEGKTLVATLPLYLNALEGKGVHLVTVNDYLSSRDAEWMGPIYHFLGLSVGVINHEKSYLFDPNPQTPKTSGEQLKMDPAESLSPESEGLGVGKFLREVPRKEAYTADITYGTNNEFGFDYLRDNMANDLAQMVQRNLHYAIVDEVDSILIDEARTPLIISSPAEEATEKYLKFASLVDRLVKELKLTPEQMQERFKKIIEKFNNLVMQIAEPEYKEKWQVSVADGSVAFGSAKENWALSVPYMKKKGISFKDIYRIYEMEEKEREAWVWQNAPLFDVILDMAVKHLPSPLDAQKYRIPRIWRGDIETQFGKDLINCNPAGEVAFIITRIVIDPRSGKEICAGRLYSGTITNGMEVYANNAKSRARVQQVLVYNGIKPEQMESVPAGNVLAISGLNADVGDTITVNPQTTFEEIKHIFQPVITKSIEVVRSADLPKLIEVLRRVGKEDPSIKIEINEETGENLLSGMGELHLEVLVDRMKREFKVDANVGAPQVAYKETIKSEASGEGKYIRQTGGRGQYGHCLLRVGPKSRGEGYEFVNAIKGAAIPNEFIPSVQKGVKEALEKGVLAGYPLVDIKVTLYDGTYHEVDSSDIAFKIAGSIALQNAVKQAGLSLLEPIMKVEVTTPDEFMGTVIGDLSSKRAQILNTEKRGKVSIINALVPLSELSGYATTLRSLSQGRATYYMEPSHYEEVPKNITEKIVASVNPQVVRG